MTQKYRIKIEKIEGKTFTHIHNIMVEGSEEKIIAKIRKALNIEIEKRRVLFYNYLTRKSFAKKIVDDTDEDLIDWKSKGSDISREEFIKNEISIENETIK